MLENVHLRPAGEVEARARGQELEGGLRQLGAALASQQLVELGHQRVQVQDVGGGVGELLVAQAVGAPVGTLLLLGELDAQKLAAKILQPESVGEGARELGGDLGAVDRLATYAQRMLQHGDVEAAEV